MKIRIRKFNREQQGLTLVELMVSLVLGLVLMAGVLQLFAANKSSYQLTEAISTMQENARYAMTRLERDIRMAGFLGCTGKDQEHIVINTEFASVASSFTPDNGIEGWDADDTEYGSFGLESSSASTADASGSNWSTSTAVPTTAVLKSGEGTNSLANSDVLRVWHVDGDGILAEMSGTTLQGSSTPPYEAADTVMLTDCTSVDIAHVCSVSGNNASLNCSRNGALALLNESGASHAFKLAGWIYFVGKRGNDASNPPALFRQEISQDASASAGAADTPQELVEGVESLQLLYGEDTDTAKDGVANRYVTADDVSDWNDVVSVRVELLMLSARDDLVDGSQTVAFNGTTVTASDGRLRYPFLSTVSIRNRSR
jgi:type IV pilus assembly protein PilW